MLPPTRANLTALGRYESIETAMAADRNVTAAFTPGFPD
jgi:hypothetical protein